jgi:hypothetical protein
MIDEHDSTQLKHALAGHGASIANAGMPSPSRKTAGMLPKPAWQRGKQKRENRIAPNTARKV